MAHRVTDLYSCLHSGKPCHPTAVGNVRHIKPTMQPNSGAKPKTVTVPVPEKDRPAVTRTRFGSAREFTPAEKSLIRKVHRYMPAEQLLRLLNERLACDLGPGASVYTMEQLCAEIGNAPVMQGGANDWASLRKLLADAKRKGILDSITKQVVDDFAVVFSLNAKQVLRLKDILLQRDEEEE